MRLPRQFVLVLETICILAISTVPVRADTPPRLHGDSYHFPPVDELPAHDGMPDPFVQSDGTRLKSQEDWPGQRLYLKEMLAHYQYGKMPPRPKQFDLQRRQSEPVFDGKAVKEQYAITLERKGKTAIFHFEFIRPLERMRVPVIVKNGSAFFGMESTSGQNDTVAARHAVRRGYLLCKFNRNEVAADHADNRNTGVLSLYPEYDWGTIAAWAWAHGVVIDALDRLKIADMERIVVTGHSRGGKTALCAGIYDERVAVTAPNSSGTGGTGSMRYFEEGSPGFAPL